MSIELEILETDKTTEDGYPIQILYNYKNDNGVVFVIDKAKKELVANHWDCQGEGKLFLKALENIAEENGLCVVVPYSMK